MRYFKAKKFNWLGLSKQRTLRAKVSRMAGQLLPWSWDSFEWQLTSGAPPPPMRTPPSRNRRLRASAALRAEARRALRGASSRHDVLRAQRLLPEARAMGAAAQRAQHVSVMHMGRCVTNSAWP